jgi:type IV secretory pathway VirJ component
VPRRVLWGLVLFALCRPAVLAAPPAAEALAGIPVVELPAAAPGDTLAVIYSGDGGWRDLDKQIGELFAREGIPVVGIDSLRYFWRARRPEGLAHDLRRIVDHYAGAWGTRRVLLVGYSFGADVLPFIVNRLPPDVRRAVVQVSLLGLSSRASFEFHVADWLRAAPRPGDPAILPEAARLDLGRVQCFYGADETDTLCPELGHRGAEVVRTTGGHHFDGDYAALARRIQDGLARRAGRVP